MLAELSVSVVVLTTVEVVFVVVVDVVVDVLVVVLVIIVLVVVLVVVLTFVCFDVVDVVAVAKTLPDFGCHGFEQNPKTSQCDKR